MNPIDRYFGLECIKHEVDAQCKTAKLAADDYLAEKIEQGSPVQTSTLFGPEAGEFKRGMGKPKQIVEYNLADKDELEAWLIGNTRAAIEFALSEPEEFGRMWLETTGELPDGIARVEYEQPGQPLPAKIYKQDREVVRAKLLEMGGLLESANRLMLGEGDE